MKDGQVVKWGMKVEIESVMPIICLTTHHIYYSAFNLIVIYWVSSYDKK